MRWTKWVWIGAFGLGVLGCDGNSSTVDSENCLATEYLAGDGVCRTIRDCAAGTSLKQAPTRTSDRICTTCPEGNFCLGGDALPTPVSTCDKDQIEAQAPTPATDRICKPKDNNPPLSCDSGEYVATSGETCEPCPADHFCIGGDASPKPVRTCTVDEVEVEAPTPATDRLCESTDIIPPLSCDPGEYPSASSGTCEACPADHFCIGGEAAPTAVSECTEDEEEALPPTTSSDRQCKEKEPVLPTQCDANEYIASADGLPLVCSPLTECQATQEEAAVVATDGTSTVDRVCCAIVPGIGDWLTVSDDASWPEAITSVEESCVVYEGSLAVAGSVTVLPKTIVRVGGGFSLRGLAWENLSQLSALREVGYGLTISQLDMLTDLEGLAALQRVEMSFYLDSNALLVSLTGLRDLRFVGELTLESNNALVTLEGLGELAWSADAIWISENEALESIAELHSVAGSIELLSIAYNPSLQSLDGLQNITEIRSSLQMVGNEKICNSEVDALKERTASDPEPGFDYYNNNEAC